MPLPAKDRPTESGFRRSGSGDVRQAARAAGRALVTGGRDPFEQHGFVNTPIYRGSTVLYPTVDEFLTSARRKFIYGRKGTPTTEALENAWTDLEGAAGDGPDPVRSRRDFDRAAVAA